MFRNTPEQVSSARGYPIQSIKVSGELGVGEMFFEYDGNRVYICDILDLQDGKSKRTSTYFGDPFQAPEWRAQWVKRM
jgi:hypothetical protein